MVIYLIQFLKIKLMSSIDGCLNAWISLQQKSANRELYHSHWRYFCFSTCILKPQETEANPNTPHPLQNETLSDRIQYCGQRSCLTFWHCNNSVKTTQYISFIQRLITINTLSLLFHVVKWTISYTFGHLSWNLYGPTSGKKHKPQPPHKQL